MKSAMRIPLFGAGVERSGAECGRHKMGGHGCRGIVGGVDNPRVEIGVDDLGIGVDDPGVGAIAYAVGGCGILANGSGVDDVDSDPDSEAWSATGTQFFTPSIQ